MRFKFLILVLLFPFYSSALVTGPVELSGKVHSFDESQLTLDTADQKIEIPREFVAEKKLKVGEQMEVLVSMEQYSKVKLIKKAKK